MPRLYQTPVWQLTLPDGWSANGGGAHVQFFKPDGLGILTALTIDEESPPTRPTRKNDFKGRLAGTTYMHKSTYVRRWTLSCRGKKVMFKYSCSSKHAKIEDAEVDVIMQSLSENASTN
jgi:hypothetical protein